MNLKGIGGMKKWENVLLYGKKRRFPYNSKHEKYYKKDEKQNAWKRIGSKLISRGFSEIEDAQISEKQHPYVAIMAPKNGKKKLQKLLVSEPQIPM